MHPSSFLRQFNTLETPFYFYDISLFRRTLDALTQSSNRHRYKVHYALKANASERLLSIAREYGLGADCVSGNEVQRAVACGFPNSAIVFAGVGKTDREICYALDQDIFCFNCESLQELSVLNALALQNNKIARVALRINPNVSANTHHYITTGLSENKFGINTVDLPEALALLKSSPGLSFTGIHFHIGSQITDLDNFKNLCTRVNEIHRWFDEHRMPVLHLNLGGGLGVDYQHPDEKNIPDFEKYFSVFRNFLEVRPGQEVHFELGRALVAQCGSLISRVLYIKKGITTNFIVLDAGMTDLIRPALYQAYHKIENLSCISRQSSVPRIAYDIVGPVCESSDCFAKAVELPETLRGDLFAIRTAGAYGEVMASSYNLKEKAKAVFSDTL